MENEDCSAGKVVITARLKLPQSPIHTLNLLTDKPLALMYMYSTYMCGRVVVGRKFVDGWDDLWLDDIIHDVVQTGSNKQQHVFFML